MRADYVAGAGSYRSLAEKYGLSKDTIARRAKAEHWDEDREKARAKAATQTIQKVANAAATNAVTAQRIRAKLLAKLEKEIDALPDSIGSERHEDLTTMVYEKDERGRPIRNGRLVKRTDAGKRYKLSDLTKAYRDLTEADNVDVETAPVKVIIDV